MKKSTLMLWGTMLSALVLGHVTNARAEATATLSDGDKTLTISFTAGGDFKSLATTQWNNTLPSEYSNVQKVVFSGPELTSGDVSSLYVIANGAASWNTVDVRGVATVVKTGWNANSRPMDFYYPDGTSLVDLNAAATNYYAGNNVIALSADGSQVNIASTTEKTLSSDLSDLRKENTKTIVFNFAGWNLKAETLKGMDIDGIKNLALNVPSVNNDDWFADFEHVVRIILPTNATDLGTTTNFEYQEGSSVKVYQKMLTDWTNNVKSLQIDIVKEGGLSEVSDAHYYTDEIVNAPRVDVVGKANDADVDFFNGIKTKRLNLVGLTYVGTDTGATAEAKFKSIKNEDGLEYVVLPDLGVDGDNFVTMFAETPTLLGVAQVNSSNQHLSAALNGAEATGTMDVLTAMVGDSRKNSIRKLKISGDLNAKDITNTATVYELSDGSKTTRLSKTGHWIDSGDTENLATSQTGAFSGFSSMNTLLDFSDARFADNQDFNLNLTGLTGGSYLQTLLLPTDKSFTTIPHASLANLGTAMTGLTIPGNIKRIERTALYMNATLSKIGIKTTKTDAEGNGSYADDMIIDNGERSITLPEKLEFVGQDAFAGDDWCHDVYVLALKAPVCERNAFASNTYTGNNGFNATNGVSQEAYMKDQMSFAVLHYPSVLIGTDEEKKYTDVTRVYTLEDNTGATDANGNPLLWPSQVEWNHAYTTAFWGYLWGAWDKEKSGDGSVTFDNIDKKQDVVDGWWAAGDNTDATKYTDYIGWHQFILANRMNSKDDKENPKRDLSRFKSNDWYTFCVPYNIRKSELLEAFGVKLPLAEGDKVVVDGEEMQPTEDLYPIVSTLVGVRRNENSGVITLIFSKDLVKQNVEINAEGNAPAYSDYTDDDPIIIKEGHPYLIKPYLPESKLALANADKYVVAIADKDTDPHIYAKDEATGADRTDLRIPYEEHVVLATDGNGYGNPIEGYTYRFGGVYSTAHKVPQFGYYLANSKSQHKHIWFYHKTNKDKKWGQYSAIVAAKPESFKTLPTSDEAKQGVNPSVFFTGQSDDFAGMEAKYNMEFDEGSATGISTIKNDGQGSVVFVDGHPVVVGTARIYNVSGQYVGNSLNNLAKGVYIVNGKKYVVK